VGRRAGRSPPRSHRQARAETVRAREDPMNLQPDTTRPVRAGEELPVAALEAYLRQHLPDCPGPLVVEQFPSGHSNLTYLLRLGGRGLVLRRPPFGTRVQSAHAL